MASSLGAGLLVGFGMAVTTKKNTLLHMKNIHVHRAKQAQVSLNHYHQNLLNLIILYYNS